VSLEDLAQKTENQKAQVLASTLNTANSTFLNNDKSPSRQVGELDTRGSHFYLSLYWAQALAKQDSDSDLKAIFSPIAQQLSDNEETIVNELNSAQGKAVDIGGYFHPNKALVSDVMRPSQCFNSIIATL
jgi:isocitrate dehydrogenase